MGTSLRSSANKALVLELRKARLETGLTQQEVADQLGVQQSYVAKIETCERRLDVVEFLRLVSAIEGDRDAILNAVERSLRTNNQDRSF